MQLNIQELVTQKIKDMNDSGQVVRHLEDAVEKAIFNAIDNALNGYEVRRELEKAVQKGVSTVAAEINFSAYNGFIAEKVRQMTEGVLLNDVAEKLQKQFDSMFIAKRESIKLSEILNAYRDWLCAKVDDEDKHSLQRFYSDIEADPHGWLTFRMAKEKPPHRYGHRSYADYYFEFTLHKHRDKPGMGWINTAYIGNHCLSEGVAFKNLSDFEILILNVLYNKTPIEIDVTDEDDIDNSFDVDW